jgi:cytoskeleton protein RodZ
MASLGQELKEARESRGISLREISQATHIGMRFLQAIENDQFEQLPGGIFNRSFVRKYARQVGLDEEQVSSRFDQVMAERGIEPPKTSVNYLEDFEDRPSSGRFWLPALIFMILAAGAYAAYQYSTSTGSDSNPVAAVSPTATPTPEVPSGIRLRVVAANGDCWLRITTDENPALTKILKAGETEDFVGIDRLVVNLGNVQAVTAEINGRPMKLEPNSGKTGLRNVILTKETYQQYLQ